MRPKVSVVIPVYNRAQSILPTLRSVQDQTFRDFECLVVDDGSKDGDELRRTIEGLGDQRFRYVRRDNGGASAARNTGVDEARGEVVAFLDSDDRWLPEKLERDVAAGAQRRIVFSQVMVERSGRIVGIYPKARLRQSEPMAEYLTCRGGWTGTSTIALPLSIARKVRFDETVRFGGDDTDFAIRLAAEGAEFQMLPGSGVILLDDETGDRLSRSRDWRAALKWLDKVRPLMGRRAHLAYRGWHVGRMAADSGETLMAFRFYTEALAGGAFTLSVAIIALRQVLSHSARAYFRSRDAASA